MKFPMTAYTETLCELLAVEREICTHSNNQPPKYLKQQAQDLKQRLHELAEEIDQRFQ